MDATIITLFIILHITDVILPEIAFYVNRGGKVFFSSIAVIFEPADGRVFLKWIFTQENIFLCVTEGYVVCEARC
jgi:hypothetical protein